MRERWPQLVLGAVTVGAFVLRLAGLRQSYFGDELFTYEIATRPDLDAVIEGVRSQLEVTPPLYFILAWGARRLGDPLTWMRVPSLVAGVATVPLVYRLGVRTVGRSPALVASALFALNPLATFYSTEARAYALVTMLVTMSTLALLRALETDDWRWWAAFAALESAAMYSHYTSIFVIAAQGLWAVVLHRNRLRRLLVAHLAVAVGYLPWVPSLLADRSSTPQQVMNLLVDFSRASVVEALGRLVSGGPFVALGVLPGVLALTLLAAAATIGTAGLVRRMSQGQFRVSEHVLLIVAMAGAAPAGAFAYSALGDDMFIARNLITSLPALALVFAALLTSLPRNAAVVALACALTAAGLGAAKGFDHATWRPAYREAAAFIDARARSGDVVIELNVSGNLPDRIVLEANLRADRVVYPFSRERAALTAATRDGGRIFFVRPDLGPARSLRAVERSYHLVESARWDGLYPLSVLVYQLE
ncbi:MAG: glycosyltransferase family 39 protein [Microthrixaceae bacterium]